MAQIEIRNVSKRWGSVVGVDRMSLTVPDREFLVLLGPSGCGKTTTMRMVAGLEDPSEGEILIDGAVVNHLEPKDRDVSMVFQSYALYPNMTVYENIRFPLKIRGVRRSSPDEMVRRAAAMVELDELMERRPVALSGGQRQRVALARAIVRKPNVFLMDEPLSNLDAKLRLSTRAQIKNLSHELSITTIYVTHDQVEAMTLADRVVVMDRGIIQQVGTPTEIYDRPENTFVAGFIGTPAMNLIEGAMVDGVFTAPDTRISGLLAPSGPAVLGFRAEDVIVGGAQSEITAPVYTLEMLGDATMVSVRIGGALVTGKADKTFRAKIGEPVSLHIPAEHCHLFDAATGLRIAQPQKH